MRHLRLAVVLALLILVGCGVMTPQQQGDALSVIDEMLKNGCITQAQWQAMRDAILAASTTNWWSEAAKIVLGAGLAYVGVQTRRGPVATPEERAKRKAVARNVDSLAK